ncbi:MAG TPA: 3-hydroxyacyl-CoA dehydrogenase NAD-binding domain-containing protein [Pseudolabrys sp.]|nr:3-hydroxyacyl-CoA dehydrogenase NAD-binding domain-containing protein [Pseudolabrys sp.]
MAQRVSVIGAGTIGASWAAYFLARGFEVAAYDPTPNGEEFARHFIDDAWPTLEKLNAVQPGADRRRFSFFKDSGLYCRCLPGRPLSVAAHSPRRLPSYLSP